MCKMVYGRSTGIHADLSILMRDHRFYFSCQCVVKLKFIFHLNNPPCFAKQNANPLMSRGFYSLFCEAKCESSDEQRILLLVLRSKMQFILFFVHQHLKSGLPALNQAHG